MNRTEHVPSKHDKRAVYPNGTPSSVELKRSNRTDSVKAPPSRKASEDRGKEGEPKSAPDVLKIGYHGNPPLRMSPEELLNLGEPNPSSNIPGAGKSHVDHGSVGENTDARSPENVSARGRTNSNGSNRPRISRLALKTPGSEGERQEEKRTHNGGRDHGTLTSDRSREDSPRPVVQKPVTLPRESSPLARDRITEGSNSEARSAIPRRKPVASASVFRTSSTSTLRKVDNASTVKSTRNTEKKYPNSTDHGSSMSSDGSNPLSRVASSAPTKDTYLGSEGSWWDGTTLYQEPSVYELQRADSLEKRSRVNGGFEDTTPVPTARPRKDDRYDAQRFEKKPKKEVPRIKHSWARFSGKTPAELPPIQLDKQTLTNLASKGFEDWSENVFSNRKERSQSHGREKSPLGPGRKNRDEGAQPRSVTPKREGNIPPARSRPREGSNPPGQGNKYRSKFKEEDCD